MPSDDVILNLKQIAGYPPSAVVSSDTVVVQRGGLGGPYMAVEANAFVSGALADGSASLQVGLAAPSNAYGGRVFSPGFSTVSNGWFLWNAYETTAPGGFGSLAGGLAGGLSFAGNGWGFFTAASPGAWTEALNISPTGYVSGGEQIVLDRDPLLPMEAATAQYVQNSMQAAFAVLNSLYATATVWSFNNRIGNVILGLNDVMGAGGAPIFSPVFQGQPTAPTPSPADNSGAVATTQWVWQAISAGVGQNTVSSFNGRTGAVTLSSADVATAGATVFAPLASPAFGGVPTAPTAATANSTGQLATTAFVHAAVTAATAGVASFNTRTGAVVMTAADVTGVGGALLAGPVFTGVPTCPTASPGTSSLQIASTAFVGAAVAAAGYAPLASPALTGVPTAPTAAANTATTQLATTAFVVNQISAVSAGVTTFNGRSGAVSLIANDLSGAGGALLAGPAFSGVPTAPTAAAATNTTQLATCAFVMAAVAQPATAAPLMNQTAAAVGTSLLYARQDHVHPTDTTRAAQSSLANYLLLTGGALTGALTSSSTAAFGGGNVVCYSSAAGNPAFSLYDSTGTSARGSLAWSASTTALVLTNAIASTSLSLDSTGTFSYNGGTGVAYKTGGGSWTAPSDGRIKTVEGDYGKGLDDLVALRPIVYRYKGDAKTPFVGLVAQEAEPHFPGMVSKRKGFIDGVKVDDLRFLDPSELVFALINAVKTLSARVAALEAA